jgi:hypothetical protein
LIVRPQILVQDIQVISCVTQDHFHLV